MANKRMAGVIAGLMASTLLLAGCSAASTGDSGTPSGTITVLTNRTDIVNTTFKKYAADFQKIYPKVTVKFQAITDYEGEVKTRLNTKNYGDVLLIPNTVSRKQLPQFFDSLGSVADMKKTYRFVDEQSYNGKDYGVAITGNAQGLVYNKKVWTAAGITTLPKTPDEFISDLKAIKAKTSATPYYTNYKDGWPLSQWEGNRGILGDTQVSNQLVTQNAPWSKGQYHYIEDSLLYNIVSSKLSEADPLTTNWENSKALLGGGKVATMLLGSWAITQMQQAAVTAGGSASDIAYMPFPYQAKGTFYSTIGGDYKNAISKYSTHKAAARAWIDWFAAKSNYAYDNGGISPLLSGKAPATLTDFTAAGVKYIELAPPSTKNASLEPDIANAAEIDLFGNVYRQKLIDIARGAAAGSMSSYFDQLNKEWATAKSQVSS
jgi:raffinose/stachyose/melibiose transport system substrate-binding protein